MRQPKTYSWFFCYKTKQGEPGAPGEEGLQGKDGLKVIYTSQVLVLQVLVDAGGQPPTRHCMC